MQERYQRMLIYNFNFKSLILNIYLYKQNALILIINTAKTANTAIFYDTANNKKRVPDQLAPILIQANSNNQLGSLVVRK